MTNVSENQDGSHTDTHTQKAFKTENFHLNLQPWHNSILQRQYLSEMFKNESTLTSNKSALTEQWDVKWKCNNLETDSCCFQHPSCSTCPLPWVHAASQPAGRMPAVKVTLPAAMDYTDVQSKAEYDTAFEWRSEAMSNREERDLQKFWANQNQQGQHLWLKN